MLKYIRKNALTEDPMKKIVSLLIVTVMLVSCISASIPVSAVTHGYIAGDANDDSAVNMKDVIAIRYFIAGLSKKKDIFRKGADIEQDNEINMKDVLKLRYVLAGVESAEGNNTDKLYKVDEFKIAGKNISRFTIVYPNEAANDTYCLPAIAYAASELKNYINQACGVALNIAYENDSPVDTYKIAFKFDENDEYGLGKEGFVLETAENGDFNIICGNMRGPVYAAYTFLEELLGYRFLTDSITYLYKNSVIDVPDGYSDVEIPSVNYRAIGANDPGALYLQLKVNASDGAATASMKDTTGKYGGAVGTNYIHAHSFVYYMAGFEHRFDPDLDSVAGGEQPCMTDEETYEKCIDFMYKLVEWRRELGQIPGFHYTQISCSANDNGNYCTCSNCKRAYSEDRSVAGALIRLCNRVTEKFCSDYPMLEVYTAAYAGSHIPPKMTRPDPRLNICFCCVGCNNHSLRNTEECEAAGGNRRLLTGDDENVICSEECTIPQSNGLWMGFLKGWLELTDNIWFWYYTDNWAYYVSPAPNLFNFYDDIKYLNELGIHGFYLEGDADRINYSFEALRIYLMTKMMWNPEMTEEEYVDLMDEFLMIYYGPGWESIKEFIYMENICGDLEGCWTNNFDYPWNEYNKEYYRQNYEHFRDLFTAAYNATDDIYQKDRIEKCSVHMNFLGLSATYQQDWVEGDAASQEKYRGRYEWLWNYYNNHPKFLTLNTTFLAKEGAVGGMWSFPTSPNNPCDPMNWLLDGGDFTGRRN